MIAHGLLEAFFETIEVDARIAPVHVSLYFALAVVRERVGGDDYFEIERAEIMQLAKINARSTFNICMNELVDFGYIRYEPANGSGVRSRVGLRRL